MVMKKFNVKDRVFLDEAIHAFLRESKKFEEESELLGKRPIITYNYWVMMAKDVQDKLETFSTQKANRQSKMYNEEIKQYE
tara:strand:+ start:483 stop:725 length:243 start_codon:yes stop_codon:yes gene_type:complete